MTSINRLKLPISEPISSFRADGNRQSGCSLSDISASKRVVSDKGFSCAHSNHHNSPASIRPTSEVSISTRR